MNLSECVRVGLLFLTIIKAAQAALILLVVYNDQIDKILYYLLIFFIKRLRYFDQGPSPAS